VSGLKIERFSCCWGVPAPGESLQSMIFCYPRACRWINMLCTEWHLNWSLGNRTTCLFPIRVWARADV